MNRPLPTPEAERCKVAADYMWHRPKKRMKCKHGKQLFVLLKLCLATLLQLFLLLKRQAVKQMSGLAFCQYCFYCD